MPAQAIWDSMDIYCFKWFRRLDHKRWGNQNGAVALRQPRFWWEGAKKIPAFIFDVELSQQERFVGEIFILRLNEKWGLTISQSPIA